MDKPETYSGGAIVIHWLMVVLIFTLFGLGWYMSDLPKGSPERTWFFALHKSIGLTTALMAVLRIFWRLTHTPPALPGNIEQWKRRMAEATHHLLYVLMFIQPVSGYISSSFSGYSTRFWGIPLPDWGWKDESLNQLFTDIHVASSIALLTLIVLHILGAVHHGINREDSVLRRMFPVIKHKGLGTRG
ncbi:MAG: cytochrome b [Gammaproteobacteria bacterium]